MNTFKHFTIDVVKIVYPTYIRPHLEFASSVWNALSKGDLDKLERMQKRVKRQAYDLRGLEYEDRMARLDFTTIELRRLRGDLIQYYKIRNGLDDIKFIQVAKTLSSSRPHAQIIQREKFENCSFLDINMNHLNQNCLSSVVNNL